MLLVQRDTPALTPARDPVWYELECQGYELTPPVAAVYTIGLVQNPTNGQTFVLTLNDEAITFTFVTDAPDDSGVQVRIGSNITVTLGLLAEALQGNYQLDQAFIIEEGDDVVTLTAREPGPITLGLTNTIPVTMMFTSVSAGSTGSFASNYSANVQVWVEHAWNSGVYEPVPASFADPKPDTHLVCWNLRSDLKPYVKWTWPTYAFNGMVIQRDLIRRYYLTRWEALGNPAKPRRVYRSSVKRAWYAGSRNLERNNLQEVFALLTRTDLLNPFLTYRGRAGRHEVSREQHSYIGYYRRTPKVSGQQIKLVAIVYYTDGTYALSNEWTDANGSGFEAHDVCLFATGFDVLGLGVLSPTKEPYKYTVQVRDHLDNALSELHTYWLTDTDANEVHLEWVNGFGVVESHRCQGQWEHGMALEAEEVQRLLTVNLNLLPPVTESNATVLHNGAQRSWTLSSGYLPKGEFLVVAGELLTSPQHKLVDHDRKTHEPVQLVQAQVVLQRQGTDDEHLYALNLTLRAGDAELAWSDRLHMPELPSTADPGDPTPPDDV